MKQYDRIIFVDKSGNLMAPMAAEILNEYKLKFKSEVLARGLVVLFPEPMNQKAEAVLISNGINMEGFTSSQLEEKDLEGETLVLAMNEDLAAGVLKRFPSRENMDLGVLTAYVGEELEIVDPYGGTLQAYGLCYEMLRKTVFKLVNLLNEDEEETNNEL